MSSRWLLLCFVGVLAGCQSRGPQKVVERLPAPYHVHEPIAPPPAPQPDARIAPVVQPEAGWVPPEGISPRWTSIVIHHTASASGSLREIDQWHRDNGWDCCGYHFVIGNGTGSASGQIEVGQRWRTQAIGAHTRLYGAPSSPEGNYYNEHGIGIVLVGDFDQQRPNDRQMDSLARLVAFLSVSCGIPRERIYLHGDLKSTDCPGRHFSRVDLGRRLAGLHPDFCEEQAVAPRNVSYTQLAAGLNR